MILRSVTKHVRDQNWVAVWLDFLIVVAGVFIGIQVSNWNDERKAQSDLNTSLENLAQEVGNTATRLEALIKWQQRGMHGYELLLDLLDGEELDDEERSLAYEAIELAYPPPTPSRYETLYELQNSGRLKDIPSRELRGALGELLSIDRLDGRYYDNLMSMLTAPPFSSQIITYELSEPDETGQRVKTVTDVDLELARREPNFRMRVIEMYSLYKNNHQNQMFILRMDRLILELLKSNGYTPSANWLEQNRASIFGEAG